MSLRLVLFTFLFSAVFVYAKNPETSDSNLDIPAKEGRALIEVPIIGSILFIMSKFGDLTVSIISTLIQLKVSFISTIIQLKLAAVTFLFSIPSLIYQHCIPIAVATVAILGYCAVTSMSSLFYSAPVQEYDMDHRLFYAARSLEQANNRYIGLE